jgi:hypothetical protein
LPAEIAGFEWYDGWHPRLLYVDFGADGDGLQDHGYFHDAGKVRIIELIGVADALMRWEAAILPWLPRPEGLGRPSQAWWQLRDAAE